MVMRVKVRKAWQCAQENEVGHRQAEEVNIAALPLFQAIYVTEHNQKVSGETDAEFDAIGRRQEVPLQHVINIRAVQLLRMQRETRQQVKEQCRKDRRVVVRLELSA